MTDSRVPRWSDMIDTNPYATNGTMAAMPSSSANRVAMWRIFMSVAARPLSDAARTPETKVAHDVAAGLGGRHDEALADRARTLHPRQKNGGRIVNDGLLKSA